MHLTRRFPSAAQSATLTGPQQVEPDSMNVPTRNSLDVFVASPMASVDDVAFATTRGVVLAILAAIRAAGGTAFSAIERIATKLEFDAPNVAVMDDLDALDRARSLVLFYPAPVATSALVEVGYALAREKTIVLLAPQRDVLPYVLTQIDDRRDVRFEPCSGPADVVEALQRSALLEELGLENAHTSPSAPR